MRVPFLAPSMGEQDEILQSEVLYQRGVARVRDLIAPSAIKVSANSLQAGETVTRTHFIIAYPRYLNTNWFAPVVNLDFPMDVAMFIHPVDTRDILKSLLKSATRVESSIQMEAEAGKVRSPILETALQDINELRDKLQQGTEKFFRFGIYIALYASSIEELNRMSRSIESLLEAQLVYVKPAVMRMEQAFTSTRPIAMDELDGRQ
jgi:conjugal transfer ATP-binding protein TraC